MECEARRYFGEAQLLPWLGRFKQYRRWHGVLVPTVCEASWVLNGQRQPYARFVVRELEFELLCQVLRGVLRIYGGTTAVRNWRGKLVLGTPGGEAHLVVQRLEVYVKKGAQWCFIAGQDTGVAPPGPPRGG